MATHRVGNHAIFRCGAYEALLDCVPQAVDRSCLQGYLRVLVLRETIDGLNYAQQVLLEAPRKVAQRQACAVAP